MKGRTTTHLASTLRDKLHAKGGFVALLDVTEVFPSVQPMLISLFETSGAPQHIVRAVPDLYATAFSIAYTCPKGTKTRIRIRGVKEGSPRHTAVIASKRTRSCSSERCSSKCGGTPCLLFRELDKGKELLVGRRGELPKYPRSMFRNRLVCWFVVPCWIAGEVVERGHECMRFGPGGCLANEPCLPRLDVREGFLLPLGCSKWPFWTCVS